MECTAASEMKTNIWASQKRYTDEQSNKAKRYKFIDDDKQSVTPVIEAMSVAGVIAPSTLKECMEHNIYGLSPITEISNNLFEADLGGTPKKSSGRTMLKRSKNLKRFTQFRALQSDLQHGEYTLYDGNVHTNPTTKISPKQLLPETSPCRLQIIEELQELQPQYNESINSTNLRSFHSLSSNCSNESSSLDDEYMALYEIEANSVENVDMINLPSDLNTLISGEIKNERTNASISEKTPELRKLSTARRCLSMTISDGENTPSPRTNRTFKCPEHPVAFNEQIPVLQSKYVRSKPPKLRKSMSMGDAEIMSALERSEQAGEPELIGDFSKPYALPLIAGRHHDLKSISSDTLVRLIMGEFAADIESFQIIDCRYPYEFEGGHIVGAKNLYTHEQIINTFSLNQQQQQQPSSSSEHNLRNIVIFHCEFSSERGPKLLRFLRNSDRTSNTKFYPALDYPELYILHNGYKEFFETHPEYCSPLGYRPMLEPAYNSEYRHFRAKSKSWNGDFGLGSTANSKKPRSRFK